MHPEQILTTARQEFELHPKANLRDYYKLFFQAIFGPGHFISNHERTLNFLQQELASATSFEDHLFQKITFVNTFYRVNLKVVKLKLVCLADFFQGFLKSSSFQASQSFSEWISLWHTIATVLKKSPLKIADFEEASQQLERNLINNDFVISHSEIYRTTYSPHYRLFTEKEFKKLGIVK